MLSARGLSCTRDGRRVLHEIELELAAGEVLGVLGANGAGKSSLLGCLAGELPASAGQVLVEGRPLATWSAGALARRRAVLPQSPSLGFDLDVEVVVGMGAYPFAELSPGEVRDLSAHALRMADAAHLAERRYRALSGGEQQRVHFARVLVQVLAARRAGSAAALLLDEPVASLDPRHQLLLMACAKRLARTEKVAVLVVLHDVNLAARWCDRLLLMAAGRTVAWGRPADVLRPEAIEQVYGIGSRVVPHPAAVDVPLVLFDEIDPPA